MGDPGWPVMLALLAVPVGVVLFVVVLALLGRRWEVPLAETDPDLDLDEMDYLEDLDLGPEFPPLQRPAPPVWELPAPAPPPAPERALPAPPPRAALPPARPRYGAYSHDPYAPPETDDSSSQAFPYGPYRHT